MTRDERLAHLRNKIADFPYLYRNEIWLLAELDAATQREREMNERHGIQLAAISMATLQNTATSARERITPESPYYTAAYADVCSTVDREIALRARVQRLTDALEKLPCRCDRNVWANGTRCIRCAALAEGEPHE